MEGAHSVSVVRSFKAKQITVLFSSLDRSISDGRREWTNGRRGPRLAHLPPQSSGIKPSLGMCWENTDPGTSRDPEKMLFVVLRSRVLASLQRFFLLKRNHPHHNRCLSQSIKPNWRHWKRKWASIYRDGVGKEHHLITKIVTGVHLGSLGEPFILCIDQLFFNVTN